MQGAYAHGSFPPIYKVKGYGIDGFNADSIEIGKVYRVYNPQGALDHQVISINQPNKGDLKLLRINTGDTVDVTIDIFVKVMRGRGIPD